MKGLFITMEGPDGAGKTTVINQLIPLLQKHALVDIVSTREPGGSRIAEDIRKVILDVNNTERDERTEAKKGILFFVIVLSIARWCIKELLVGLG